MKTNPALIYADTDTSTATDTNAHISTFKCKSRRWSGPCFCCSWSLCVLIALAIWTNVYGQQQDVHIKIQDT